MAYARSVFNPESTEPYKASRSKIDLFMQCRRCAYLDMRLGVKRPSGPSFTLNNAVDELFKKEFDIHRANGTPHPLAKEYNVDVVPLDDPRMVEWRDALRRGIQYHHKKTNLILRGGIDDIWKNEKGEIHIVDYKATSKKIGPTTDEDLYDEYKRQAEIYQWLFRMNDFKVSPIAYFVYANGRTDEKAFDGKLEFDIALIPYRGDDSWVEKAITDMHAMLMSEEIPDIGTSFGGGPCDFCTYREAAGKILKAQHQKTKVKKDDTGTKLFSS